MKKILAAFLSVTVLLATCLTAFPTFASESSAKDYTLPASWGLYKTGNSAYPSTLNGASPHSWMFHTSDTVLCGGENSLRMDGSSNLATAATKLEGLVPGTVYAVSFKFYVPASHTAGSAGYIFKAGIYKSGAPIVTGGAISDTSFMLCTPQNVTSATGSDSSGSPVWQDATLTFTAPSEDTYLGLSFRYGGSGDDYGNIYIADISVDLPQKEYNDPAVWGLYKNQSSYSGTVNGNSAHSWMFHEETLVKPGEKTAVRFDGSANLGAAATKLTGLTAGKKYTLSFKYYIPLSHKSGSTGYIFKAGVYGSGTTVDNYGLVTGNTELATPITVTESTGVDADYKAVWETAELTFTATAEQYIIISSRYGANPEFTENYGSLYFADFEINEVLKSYDKPTDYALYKTGSTAYPNKIDGTSDHSWMFYASDTVKYMDKNTVRISSSANVATMATKLENLTANVQYKLSFRYYVPASHTVGGGGYIFKAGVYKKDAPIAAGGVVTDTSYQLGTPLTVTAATGKNALNEPIWNKAELTFTADSEQYLGLAIRYMGSGEDYGNIYIADVKISPVLTAKDYDIPASWRTYRNGSHTSINGAGVQSIQSETAVTFDGGAKALRINKENLATVATSLSNLTAGKKYAVSFKYYITEETAKGSGGYIFKAGVYKKDAPLTVGVDVSDKNFVVADPISVTTATGKDSAGNPIWADFVTTFTAADAEQYLGIAVRVTTASGVSGSDPNYALIYIDNFEVYEIGAQDLGATSSKFVIDFEDNKTYIDSNLERFEIVGAANDSGESSKMLYYKNGTYPTDTRFNMVKTLTDNDKNFTLPIRDDKVYKISYKYKIASGDNALNWLSFYTSFNGEYSVSENYNLANLVAKDTWQTYETYYSPSKGQSLVSLSFKLSNQSAGVWIDDITLEETDRSVFEGHKPYQSSYEINFDDFDTPLDSIFMKVENAPARDGEVTKALHLSAATSPENVTLNKMSIDAKKEKVFAIPVEPDTNYIWSFWAYSVGGKPATFNFYYNNYDGAFLTNNFFAYSKEEVSVGNWQKYTVEFKTLPNQTKLYTWFDAGTITKELWLDDIRLEKMYEGTVSSTDLFYCEDFYNLVGNEQYQNLQNAVSGVYEVEVPKNTVITFSVKGEGNGSIALSLDGQNAMPLGSSEAPSSTISFAGAENETALHLLSGEQGKVYIILNNAGGLQLDELMLFASRSAHFSDTAMGYETDPEQEYTVPVLATLVTK